MFLKLCGVRFGSTSCSIGGGINLEQVKNAPLKRYKLVASSNRATQNVTAFNLGKNVTKNQTFSLNIMTSPQRSDNGILKEVERQMKVRKKINSKK